MSEIVIINSAKSCCVSGHRRMQGDLDVNKLKQTFLQLIDDGVDTFLVGMALGFDALCFRILEEIRNTKNIKIIACIPCKNQDYKYTESQRQEYQRMLKSANEQVWVGDVYTPYCMHKRNRFMVDNSYCLVAYLRQDKSGTNTTVRYAKELGRKIILL